MVRYRSKLFAYIRYKDFLSILTALLAKFQIRFPHCIDYFFRLKKTALIPLNSLKVIPRERYIEEVCVEILWIPCASQSLFKLMSYLLYPNEFSSSIGIFIQNMIRCANIPWIHKPYNHVVLHIVKCVMKITREEKKVRCLHCKRFGRTRHEKAVTIHAYMIQLCIGTVFNFDNNVSIPCVPPSLTRERKKIMLIIIIKCETEKVNHNLCGAYLSCHDTIYSIEFSDLRWEGTSEDCPPEKYDAIWVGVNENGWLLVSIVFYNFNGRLLMC